MTIMSFIHDIFAHRTSDEEAKIRKGWRDSTHEARNELLKSAWHANQAMKTAESAESKLRETIKSQESSSAGLRDTEMQYVRLLRGKS